MQATHLEASYWFSDEHDHLHFRPTSFLHRPRYETVGVVHHCALPSDKLLWVKDSLLSFESLEEQLVIRVPDVVCPMETLLWSPAVEQFSSLSTPTKSDTLNLRVLSDILVQRRGTTLSCS